MADKKKIMDTLVRLVDEALEDINFKGTLEDVDSRITVYWVDDTLRSDIKIKKR